MPSRWTILAVAILGVSIAWGVGNVKDRFDELFALRGEKAATVKELSDLKQLLSEKQRAAVEKGVISKATVVRSTASHKERIEVKGDLCKDWVDAEGRFYFHADSRTLDVDQRFRLNVSIVEGKSGHLFADTEVWELSPKTGEPIGVAPWTVDHQEVFIAGRGRERSRYALLLGAQASLHGIVPFMRAEYRFLGPLVAGVDVSDDARAYVGWRHEF